MSTGLNPITRQEIYLSSIADESELPSDMDPITREEIYLNAILGRIKGIGTPSKEDIATAVNAYLDEHGIGDNLFIASTDIPEVLEG